LSLDAGRRRGNDRLPRRSRILLLAVIAFALLSAAVAAQAPRAARAVIWQLALLDPASPGFSNGDGDLLDAAITLLANSDGIPGNTSSLIDIDTVYATVGSTVWFGIAANEGDGPVTVDSNDVGTFIEAICGDPSGNGKDFEIPADRCLLLAGVGTDKMFIPDDVNFLEGMLPQTPFPKMGIAVAYRCPETPVVANITASQGIFRQDFFIVCTGPVSRVEMSASIRVLEILPQRGSTAHALIRLDLFDSTGKAVAPIEIDWFTERCGIETASVTTLQGTINVITGALPIHLTQAPDTNHRVETSKSLIHDFSGDGVLDAVALAILHCEPSEVPGETPGPFVVTARVFGPSGVITVGLQMKLIGPPAVISMTATPSSVRCGEKVTVRATVKDAAGQEVSDDTPIGFKTNVGGTAAAPGLLGVVAPVSSSIGFTYAGVAETFVLTSTAHVGTYEVVATGTGVFSTPPVTGQVSFSCFLPTPTPAPTTAATQVAAAPRQGITPPSTGDAGLVPPGYAAPCGERALRP
jgi:hypothetical protein